MFYNQDHVYFGSVRKITTAFGALFSNVKIHRHSGNGNSGAILKSVDVPLFYGPGQKYLKMQEQQTRFDEEKARVRMTLPRISFEMTGFEYDPARQLQNTAFKIIQSQNVDSNGYRDFIKLLNPVPYNITYQVNIITKNIDDALQIVEQVLPYFTPFYNLNIKEIPELGIERDIPVILNSTTWSDQYEGNFNEDRVMMQTLTFTCKGYIYPNITNTKVIKHVLASIFDTDTNKEELIKTDVDPIDATVDNFTAKTTIYDKSQLDTNGDPIV